MMPSLLPILVAIALVADAGTFALARVPHDTGVAARSAAALDTVTLHIEGMTCGGCTLATRKVLERLDGVAKADVSYEHKRAVVTFDPAKVTVDRTIAAVATLKYTATVVGPVGPSGS